ncbi:MAG: tyrosine-protein phosphatase [Pseudomonadales bacterium]|nr:tyrosine-protein phosphatase [Pseudomonadales bacterium]
MTTRAIHLEGGFNVRDLGGYQSRDGRTVKWGKLFRSGHLAHLTPGDIDTLAQKQISQIHDFRGKKEQSKCPANRFRPNTLISIIFCLAVCPSTANSLREAS